MTVVEIIALTGSVLSVLVSLTVIITFVINRRKEREDDAKWKQRVNDQLDQLTERVDSHNNYAELFNRYAKDIADTREDIAFIRGKLEK